MHNFDVIIVGGGLVGACFALDLAQKNPSLEIALLEVQPIPIETMPGCLDSKIYAISPNNLDYLARIGVVLDEARLGNIQKMEIFGDSKSNLNFDAKSVNKFFLAKTIECNYLQSELYNQLSNMLNVHLIYGKIDDINLSIAPAHIICSEKIYTANLIVGADGANSTVRKYAKLETQVISYDQSALVANFECEISHGDIAYQWFDVGNTLAYLPLPNNQISIVWSHAQCADLINLSEEELCDKVAKSGNYVLGKLRLVTKPKVFPLKLHLVDRLYNKNIVLIGDAAHTLHPLAGQGVNLGFADAAVLAGIIGKAKKYQIADEAILAKYNRVRIPEIRQMQLTCHALYNIFDKNQSMVKYVRNCGMSLVNNISFIKKYLINSAIKY